MQGQSTVHYMPNYGHTGPHLPHFHSRPPVPSLFCPQVASIHPPQLFPQPMSPTPTSSQLWPQLHPLTPTSQLHPQNPSSQLCPSIPAPQLHPKTSVSQPHPLPPISQLRRKLYRKLSQLHPASQTPASQSASQLSPHVPLMNRLQDTPPQTATLRPQTASYEDIYATHQRTITCVRNYASIPSPGLSSSPCTSTHGSQQQPIPHQQIESSQACSEPATLQLCICVPIQTSPCGTHHVIHRPKPIHSCRTACGIPGFSPALQPIVPFSPTLREHDSTHFHVISSRDHCQSARLAWGCVNQAYARL